MLRIWERQQGGQRGQRGWSRVIEGKEKGRRDQSGRLRSRRVLEAIVRTVAVTPNSCWFPCVVSQLQIMILKTKSL